MQRMESMQRPLCMEDWAKCRIFVASREGTADLSKISPFLIERVIRGKVGEVVRIERFKRGMLLIETSSDNQSRKLLTLTQLSENVKVSVTPHRSLNFSRGVITCGSLDCLSEEEILTELESQKAVFVRRITKKYKGEISRTNSYIITFLGGVLPEKIKAGFQLLTVKPYIPAPIRCYRCYRFNHYASSCKEEDICFLCSQKKHSGNNCKHPIKCINCNDNHPSISRKCPIFKRETEIKKIEIVQKVPYQRAKEILNKPQTTFSKIVATTPKIFVNNYTQTKINKEDASQKLPNKLNQNTTKKYTEISTQTDRHEIPSHKCNCNIPMEKNYNLNSKPKEKTVTELGTTTIGSPQTRNNSEEISRIYKSFNTQKKSDSRNENDHELQNNQENRGKIKFKNRSTVPEQTNQKNVELENTKNNSIIRCDQSELTKDSQEPSTQKPSKLPRGGKKAATPIRAKRKETQKEN